MATEHSIQHTPGPWSVELYNSSADSLYGSIAIEPHIAGLSPLSRGSRLEAEANARLIAAAPALLAALEEMIRQNEPAREDSPRRASWMAARRLVHAIHGNEDGSSCG